MLKRLAAASLFFAFTFGTAAMAVAQAMTPPSSPGTRYVLPGAAAGHPGYRLWEGRSIYQSEDPSRFPNHVDEQGYQSGMPENPRTGN